MRKIRDIIYTILLILVILLVYRNIDTISEFFTDLLVSNEKVTIKEANNFKRKYNYVNFNYNINYIPYTKDDIINIYFNVLNNGWKEFAFYCPKEYKTCMDDVETVGNDNTLMSNINNYVSPFNSFENIKTTISSTREININVTPKYDDEMIKVLDNKVNKVITELNVQELSNREKIEKVHDYILSNTVYDSESDNLDTTSAYGSLILGHAVCSGYSDAMALFLDKFNIPNLKISSANHVWNLVYLDNNWLHLDLTWDDIENNRYRDNYFLITKEKLLSLDTKEHNFDNSFFVEGS